MAIYSDDFAGTGAVSGSWTVTRNSLARDSGNLAGGVNDYNNMLWSANSVVAAQFSEGVISAANAFYCNVSVRASGTYGAGTWSHYCLVCNPGSDFRLERWVNNSQTSSNLVSLGTVPSNGDTIRLEIDAAYNLSVYVNGSLRATFNDTSTPAALASGSPGCGCYSTNSRLASWSGGDLIDNRNGAGVGHSASGANAASAKGGIATARAASTNQASSTSVKQGSGAAIAANGNASLSVSRKGAFGASNASGANASQSVSAKGSIGAGHDGLANSGTSVSRKGAFAVSISAGPNSDQAASTKGIISIAIGHSRPATALAGSAKGGRGNASANAGNSGWAVSVAGAIGGGNGFAYNSNSGFATSLHGGRGAGQEESSGVSNSSSAKGGIGAGQGVAGNQSVSVSRKGVFAAGRAVGSGIGFSSSTNTSAAIPNVNGAGRGFGSASSIAGSRKGGRGAGLGALSVSSFASASAVRLPFYSNIAPQANIRISDVWWRKDYITEDGARHLFELFKEKAN